MPLEKDPIILDDVSVYLWKIEETKDELLSLCHNLGIDTSFTENIRSNQRACEKLATRLLLCHIFGNDFSLEYNEAGAPHIKDSTTHISISHSSYLVGIAISNLYPIGLDIEHKADQVLRVREKFLNDTELKNTLSDDKIVNLWYWTAKEAIYKAIEADGIDFRNDIYKLFDSSNSFVAIKDNRQHKFEIRSFNHDNRFTITIATPQD